MKHKCKNKWTYSRAFTGDSIDDKLRETSLQWFGHVQHKQAKALMIKENLLFSGWKILKKYMKAKVNINSSSNDEFEEVQSI